MRDLKPTIDPKLYKNKKEFPQEIVYEITTKEDNLPFGIAIADIMHSTPHHHKKTVEVYTGVQGDLEVTLDDEPHIIHPGDSIRISPGVVHSAKSLGDEPARITVISIPEWSQDDFFPEDDKK